MDKLINHAALTSWTAKSAYPVAKNSCGLLFWPPTLPADGPVTVVQSAASVLRQSRTMIELLRRMGSRARAGEP